MAEQLDHEAVKGRLSAYLDGEVALGERAGIEKHLAECSPCAAFLAELRAVAGLVKKSALGQLRGDAEFVRRVHEQVEALRRRGLERFAWGLAGLAACLAVAATLQLVRPMNATAPATAVVPAAWEGAAVRLNPQQQDDTAAANNTDLAMTEWMVADLSQGNRAQ